MFTSWLQQLLDLGHAYGNSLEILISGADPQECSVWLLGAGAELELLITDIDPGQVGARASRHIISER